MKLKRKASLTTLLSIRPRDAVADIYFPESFDDVVRFSVQERSYHLLAGGTNVIAGTVKRPVLSLRLIDGASATREEEGDIVVTMPAWVRTAQLIDYLIANGLSGAEFMAGIPGTIGGAVTGNAAPKDHSWEGVVRSLVYVKEGSVLTATPQFSYRRIVGMPRPPYIVLAVDLALKKERVATVRARVRRFMKARLAIPYPSAGSLFKNPKEAPAGKLLEEAGCKGLAVGDAALYEKHANIVINRGNAAYGDFVALRDEAAARVRKMHGIRLEPEVKFWE